MVDFASYLHWYIHYTALENDNFQNSLDIVKAWFSLNKKNIDQKEHSWCCCYKYWETLEAIQKHFWCSRRRGFVKCKVSLKYETTKRWRRGTPKSKRKRKRQNYAKVGLCAHGWKCFSVWYLGWIASKPLTDEKERAQRSLKVESK